MNSGTKLGPYSILAPLGRGGMGEVYRAQDTRLGREVAIKVLPVALTSDTTRLQRFEREARTACALNHPNILTVHDIGTHEGAPYLVTELLEGESLRESLRAPFDVPTALDYAYQIALGLAAAHEKGIVHRDMKPENIFVTSDGRLKILDFGLARLVQPEAGLAEMSETPTQTKLTQEGVIMGTVAYMSPEQARGETADARSDLFSFGVVLYEMVTGRRPFQGATTAVLFDAILNKQPVPLAELNPQLATGIGPIIEKALEKDRNLRYQSASEVLTDLKRLQRNLGLQSTAIAAKPARPRTLYAAVALALVIAVFASRLIVGPRKQPPAAMKGSIQSLAVLPLENLSGDASQDYFADGITDALIMDLAQVGSLRVISRVSVMQYKEAKKPLKEIGKELNVDAVVQGSVTRSGDRVKVRAQLIELPGERQLWAQEYEHDLSDVLRLQNEVARAIVQEIRIKLTPQQQARLAKNRPINPQAYEAYLRGMSAGGLGECIQFLQQSVKLDPDYAPAYSLMATCYYFLGLFGDLPPSEAFTKMKETAMKAIELDETFADPHGSLGLVKLHYDWDFPGAEKEFRRALELNPSADIRHDYAHYLMAMDRNEESIAESKRAVETSPFDIGLIACLAWHSLFARQYDQARDHSLKALGMEKDAWWGHMNLGWAYEQKMMFPEAIAEFQTSTTLWPGNPLALASLGHAFAVSGKKQKAQEALAMLMAQRKQGFVPAYDIATVYAGLGNIDQAFEWLQKAYEERSAFLVHMKWDPRLDNLHSDSRFQGLIKKIGLSS